MIDMEENSFQYYLFTVGAIIIPIVTYILFPGISGIPGALSSMLVFLIFYIMPKSNFFVKKNFIRNFKWLLIVILFGALHAIVSVPMNRINIVLLITHLLSWLMICICYMIKDVRSVKYFLNAYLLILIPTAFISASLWTGFLTFDVPHILLPLSLFLIISPYFSINKSIFIIIILFLSIVYDSSSRSCLLTMFVCFLFYIIVFLFPNGIVEKILKVARVTFFIAPLVLLVLGVLGLYNVFASFESLDASSYSMESRKTEGRLWNTDSRSTVYLDVKNNIDGPTDILLGKGSVIILPSSFTSDRHNVEAEILNIYLRYGLIGCVVIFVLLWKISKKGMSETNNSLTMLISVYIAYRFMFMFIEDAGINPSLYVALGICLNPSIRRMTDHQLKMALR